MEASGYVYHCSAGETFDSVALNEYHSEKYAAELMSMNPEYCRVTTFTGKEVLFLPVIVIPEIQNGAGNSAIPTTAPWKEDV